MTLETIAPPLPETQKPAEGQKHTPPANMITVDRVTAEKFMLAIEECVGDIEEQRELVDRLIASKNTDLELFQSDTIKKFNGLCVPSRTAPSAENCSSWQSLYGDVDSLYRSFCLNDSRLSMISAAVMQCSRVVLWAVLAPDVRPVCHLTTIPRICR